jgi:hypothetical protein
MMVIMMPPPPEPDVVSKDDDDHDAVKRQYVEAGAARGSRGRTIGLHHTITAAEEEEEEEKRTAEEAMLPSNEGRATAPAKKTNSTRTSMTLWTPLLTFTPV